MVRDSRVRTSDGSWATMNPRTLCLHGDGPHAVAFASLIRAELAKAGVKVLPVSETSVAAMTSA